MNYFFIFFFLLAASVLAQEETPAPEATPAPTPIAVTLTSDATPPPVPDSSPAAEPSPTPGDQPSPTPEPSPGEDIIPLPPESGAAETPMVSESEMPRLAPGETLPDSAFADPNAVIPTDTESLPPGVSGPSAQELDRKLKVRYQEVRVQVEKDPAVRSLLEQSKAAKSFEDERAALREYYRLLFKKMKKVDKALTARCDIMENAYIARLAQSRVEPTIPLNPPPTPVPLSN